MQVNSYHTSFSKRLFDIFFALIFLMLSLPFFLIFSLIIKLTSPGSIFFVQLRSGKDNVPFKILKFRTMVRGAEKMVEKYRKLNESDGPTFKIQNDPRFTRFGKYLSRTGLDELPQFINVLRGEMSVVGPRPLPIGEAAKIPKKYQVRLMVKPGATSTWVVNGTHKLKFRRWMELDRDYIKNASFWGDFKIVVNTAKYLLR